MIVLDVSYIFTVAGGPAGLLNLMARHDPGNPPNYATVQMWKYRGAIPSQWMPVVLYALGREGHPMGTLLTEQWDTAPAASAAA